MRYLSDRGRRELSLPVSIVRRCFMRMVIGSHWDEVGPIPEFDAVATADDKALHETLLRAELAPFDGLAEKDRERLHRRVLLDRDTALKPYEKGALLAGFMTGIGIIVRLQEQGVLGEIDARSEFAAALDTLIDTVRRLCPKEWATYERGTYNQAGHVLKALCALGYRYQAAEVPHAA